MVMTLSMATPVTISSMVFLVQTIHSVIVVMTASMAAKEMTSSMAVAIGMDSLIHW